MSDEDALLAAICANPREDTPRLVFADWLEEHGQAEHAAFIRNDIAMSLRDEWDIERLRWEESLTQEAFYRFGWSAKAIPPLPTHCSWFGAPITRRGFLDGLKLDYPNLLDAAAAAHLKRHLISINRLYFHQQAPDVNKLAQLAKLEQIAELEFRGGAVMGRSIAAIAADKRFESLDAFCFWGNSQTSTTVAAVCESPLFANLLTARFIGGTSRVGFIVLERLGSEMSLRIRRLDLTGSLASRDGVQRLTATRFPESLRWLELSMNGMSGERVRDLATVGNLSGLTMLSLSSNAIGNVGATAVFTSPQLAGLKVLDLSYCMVGDEALRALLENSPLVDGLNLLTLTGSPASGDMKQAVKDRMGDRVRL